MLVLELAAADLEHHRGTAVYGCFGWLAFGNFDGAASVCSLLSAASATEFSSACSPGRAGLLRCTPRLPRRRRREGRLRPSRQACRRGSRSRASPTRRHTVGIDQRERDFRHAGGLAVACAGEDDVLHVDATQRSRRLLAEHPGDGVGDVRLSAAVRAHDGGNAVALEAELGAVAE